MKGTISMVWGGGKALVILCTEGGFFCPKDFDGVVNEGNVLGWIKVLRFFKFQSQIFLESGKSQLLRAEGVNGIRVWCGTRIWII